ncbi:MAG: NAD(P)/FAD-dependent oxidoreductase [Candidatus Verstraetearchaeota archaeon]|jgi:geranylgeranyl reductase family protein|nr:NAD(P)/FAD-dependent oxidoreductase [Candidatus Verstraetearchaeota archaeon]
MEVLVVGGGPSGLIAAREASLYGVDVTLIEEDKEIGKPDHCAGLVSINALKKILGNYENVILNKIRNVRIISPMGNIYEVNLKEYKAAVIDREKFDMELMKRAEKAGVEILTNTCFNSSFKYKIMINAEGTKERICRKFGLEIPKSIPAIQYDIEVKNYENNFVEIYLGKWSPKFFVWTVPRDDCIRVGTASYSRYNLFNLIQKFIEKNSFFKSKEILRIRKKLYGKIVISGPVNNTSKNNIISVGDAAGFAKPTTGGGIAFGCYTAKIAGKIVAHSIKNNIRLSEFDRIWKKYYSSEFKKMKFSSHVFRSMSECELERILYEMHKLGIFDELSSYDMDFQGEIISKIMKSKLLIHYINLIPKILKAYIFEYFL